MTRFAFEVTLLWTAVGLYIGATALYAYALIFGHPERARFGTLAAVAGLVAHSASLIQRWVAVGHGPYMLKYEVLSSNAWILVVMALLFARNRVKWAPLMVLALPAAFLMMGLGLFTSPEARDLPPSLRSMWLVFHVFFNKLAVGAFVLSGGAAIASLRKTAGKAGRLLDRLPDALVLDAYVVRFVGFGFIFWTVTIVAGSIWANQSWGRYWGWDPIETWSLVTWLCYGSLLHVRLFFHLRPRATAFGTLSCFGISVLTVFIFPFLIPSMHSAYFQ